MVNKLNQRPRQELQALEKLNALTGQPAGTKVNTDTSTFSGVKSSTATTGVQLGASDIKVSQKLLDLLSVQDSNAVAYAQNFSGIGVPLKSQGVGQVQRAQAAAQSTPLIRGEVQNESDLKHEGQWTRADRENNTERWKKANLYNLDNAHAHRYETIDQRRDFYRWFYEHSVDEGFETRWPLAASTVANGANEIAYPGTLGGAFGDLPNELQGNLRIGNQVIFDDAFPKLKALLDGGPLKGADALAWDMRTLAEEQSLVQPMYQSMSQSTQDRMEEIAKKKGILLNAVLIATGADEIKARPGPDGIMNTSDDYNRAGTVPGLKGEIDQPRDRWAYGMELGQKFSPKPTGYHAGMQMPAPRPQYIDGSAYAAVNRRPNLHMLDAQIDETMGLASYTDIDNILSEIKKNPAEAAELARDIRPEQLEGSSEPRRYSTTLAMLVRLPRARLVAVLPEGPDKEAFLAKFDEARKGFPPGMRN
ncbi:MAG: hypothetical protein AAFN74_10205 [Myxococcota bacterium]